MAGDGNWCTPPDSPSKARHGMISASYEHAISDNDWYWDWHHDTREDECNDATSKLRTQILSSSLPVEIQRSPPIPTPREQAHDQPPPHLRSSDPIDPDKTSISQQLDDGISARGVGALKDVDDFPNVSGKSVLVAASNPAVVGFSPAYKTPCETTQIASLPGSRRAGSVDDSVILLPPKSSSSSKAPKSIEDVGHKLENYAPIDPAKYANQFGGEGYDVGCFNYLTPFGEPKLRSQDDAENSVSNLASYSKSTIIIASFVLD